MKKTSTHSARVIAVTLASSLFASGCFGTFTTLHRVYEWNRTVDPNKWAQWGVFAATMIVPIYPSAAIFDMIFANSVEFWSGRNPLASDSGQTRTFETADGQQVSLRLRDDGKIDVAIRAPGQVETRLVVVPERDAIAAYDENGVLAAIATRAPEGAPAR